MCQALKGFKRDPNETQTDQDKIEDFLSENQPSIITTKEDQAKHRKIMRIILLTLASVVVLVGLIAAWIDYMYAFEMEVNYFHAMRGMAWNVGTYTLARVVVWWYHEVK